MIDIIPKIIAVSSVVFLLFLLLIITSKLHIISKKLTRISDTIGAIDKIDSENAEFIDKGDS